MASRPKRRAVGNGSPAPRDEEEEEDEVEGEDEDDEDSDEGEDEEDEIINEEVNIEFEAYSISDNDYDGIKKLLQQLFLKAPVNTAELTDLLIQQNHIGSVIKKAVAVILVIERSDQSTVFFFLSFFFFLLLRAAPAAYGGSQWFLVGCYSDCTSGAVSQMHRLLCDWAAPVAYGCSQGFVTAEPQRTVEKREEMRKELAEAHRTNKPCGKCHFYLLISKTFVEAGKSNSKKKWSDPKKEELMFANAEEEFFYEEESDTCLGGRWSFDDVPLKPLRTVMFVPSDEMSEIMEKLTEHLSV
uniref:BRCA2 and CDKN1A-interacting protein n=1 Tax=Sus scrofa TaxID=9823 RepID=A0A8D1MPQ3_PIG